MSVNKAILIGNVGRDPEVRHLESGMATASFTMATSERFKDKSGEWKEQTEWHNIVCWRNTAELVEKYVRKGTQLYVEGKIKTRKYTTKDGIEKYVTEIVADSIQFIGKKSDNPANAGVQAQPQPQAQPQQSTDIGKEIIDSIDDSSDLPF